MASDLDQQLTQLDELLGLLDAGALRGAQEALENQIAELNERMEVTRQALAQAQAQRRRLARARLLLEESGEHNGNGDPALHAAPTSEETPAEVPEEAPAPALEEVPEAGTGQTRPPLAATAPFVAERRESGERRESEDRRSSSERRQSEDRRKGHPASDSPPA